MRFRWIRNAPIDANVLIGLALDDANSLWDAFTSPKRALEIKNWQLIAVKELGVAR